MKFCIAWDSPLKAGEQEIRICELNNEGVYIVEYPESGKREVLRSLDFRFELLFEVGCYAWLDGYYREAVSSFAAALERFYEFFVEVIARSNGVEEQQYTQCWKHLKNSSERQFGAFVGAYVLTQRQCPELLSDDWRGFRNNVIHKGAIPEKTRTLEYGDKVGRLILSDMSYLLQHHREGVANIFTQQLKTANSLIPAEDRLCVDRLSTAYLTHVLSHQDLSVFEGHWSLESQLELIRPIWLNASARLYNSSSRKLREDSF